MGFYWEALHIHTHTAWVDEWINTEREERKGMERWIDDERRWSSLSSNKRNRTDTSQEAR